MLCACQFEDRERIFTGSETATNVERILWATPLVVVPIALWAWPVVVNSFWVAGGAVVVVVVVVGAAVVVVFEATTLAAVVVVVVVELVFLLLLPSDVNDNETVDKKDMTEAATEADDDDDDGGGERAESVTFGLCIRPCPSPSLCPAWVTLPLLMGAHKYDAKDDADDDDDDDGDDLSVCYIIKHLRVFPQFEREREQEQNEIQNERQTWILKCVQNLSYFWYHYNASNIIWLRRVEAHFRYVNKLLDK